MACIGSIREIWEAKYLIACISSNDAPCVRLAIRDSLSVMLLSPLLIHTQHNIREIRNLDLPVYITIVEIENLQL
jgi:hypothetical protein